MPHLIPKKAGKALPHIRYEIEQMVKDFDGFYIDGVTQPTAVFEAFLIHVRNLMEFFDDKGGDLVTEAHFYPAKTGPLRSTKVVSHATRGLLNNELAHITWWRAENTKRSDDTREDWSPDQFDALFLACADFASHIAACDPCTFPPGESVVWGELDARILKSLDFSRKFVAARGSL